jgi:hypothetical protein
MHIAYLFVHFVYRCNVSTKSFYLSTNSRIELDEVILQRPESVVTWRE